MTRTIKASEIKPGMVVKWESEGFTHEGTVERVTSSVTAHTKRFISGSSGMYVSSDTKVTVLSEPQPEEPTEFGAKIIVDGRQFLRAPLHSSDPTPWLSHLDGTWRKWSTILAMGPVTVVSDQGWPTPGEAEPTPEVPERIEEWPEDDTALRTHQWRDWDQDIWTWVPSSSMWSCYDESGNYSYSHIHPEGGPWDRVTTNTTFNEKKENV